MSCAKRWVGLWYNPDICHLGLWFVYLSKVGQMQPSQLVPVYTTASIMAIVVNIESIYTGVFKVLTNAIDDDYSKSVLIMPLVY